MTRVWCGPATLIAACVVSCNGQGRTTALVDAGADSGAKGPVFIRSVLYRSPPQCVVKADATEEALGGGRLDLAFTKSYTAALLVGSRLTSRITLRGADIDLTDSVGNSMSKFSVSGTGSVAVSRTGDPGFGTFDAELVPASVGNELLGKVRDMKAANKPTSRQASGEVLALVRVLGTTLDNDDVRSSEFSFPITYCEGCLIEYPLIATNQQTHQCTNDVADVPQPGCAIGQDDSIDCRSCASTIPLCLNAPAN